MWAALLSPTVLQHCIPGCESLQLTQASADEQHYTAVVKVGLGPISVRFDAQVRVFNLLAPPDNQPAQCSLSFNGQAGSLGYGSGTARVTLSDTALKTAASVYHRSTHIAWQANTQVGGKLAQLGSRLIEASVRTVSEQFFKRFAQQFAQQLEPPSKAEQQTPWQRIKLWLFAFFK